MFGRFDFFFCDCCFVPLGSQSIQRTLKHLARVAQLVSTKDMVVKIVRALEAHGAGYVRDLIVVRRFIFHAATRSLLRLGESPA